MLQMDEIQKRLLSEVSGLHDVPTGAYNLRANGVSAGRQSTANIEIVSKKDVREAYDRAVVWWAEEERQMSFSTSQRVAMFEYVAFDDRFREVDRKELD